MIGSGTVYLGLGPVFTLGTDLIVSSAPPERAGAAAAISETSSEFGGALGIAVLGSLGTAIYRGSMGGTVLDGIPAQARAAAEETLGGAAAAAAQLPGQAGTQLLTAAREAFTHALVTTASICAAVAAATAVAAVVLLRRVRPAGEPARQARGRASTLGSRLSRTLTGSWYLLLVNIVDELHAVAAALVNAGVRHAVCGGVAVTVYGATRSTSSMDFLLESRFVARFSRRLRAGWSCRKGPLLVVSRRSFITIEAAGGTDPGPGRYREAGGRPTMVDMAERQVA